MTMDIDVDTEVHTNGVKPELSPAAIAIGKLRRRPRNIHLARGFGPLVVGVVLFLMMLWLAPSVAPEHIVERPINGAPTTTTVVVTTTTVAP
ncbi:MAG: hypothetical protein QOE63_1770 [Acidimicrobiaceae bacterium]|jgi:hypothetical protein